MKFMALFLIFIMVSIKAQGSSVLSRRGEFTPPPDLYDVKELNRVLFSDLRNQSDDLKKVKYFLMNGDIRLARAHLMKLAYTPTSLKPVIYRYLAILHFIESDFKKTHHYLSLPELQELPHYGKICVLKVLTSLVLEKTPTLDAEWAKCQQHNPGKTRESNLIWMDVLVQLKISPTRGVTKVPFIGLNLAALSNADTKILLKLSLYLNQESLVIDQIQNLTVEQLQDQEIRELAGQIYFRSGALARAYRFVEDLKSPNAENIKGNLYLLRDKYELAYAQFKLALEQKINSQNAIERLLPLAWLLDDWEGGSRYADYATASPETVAHKQTLMAAFTMQKGDYERAQEILTLIAERSCRGTEIEVTQLAGFTALMQNKPDMVKKQAKMSCQQYDLVNCWLLFQMGQWDAFPLTIRREDQIPEKKEWEKLIQEDINSPLKETVFINQLDIEEMDDKLIQLIPSSP